MLDRVAGAVEMKACSVTGCDKPSCSRGMCKMHYDRFRNYGSTDARLPTPVIVRFWRYTIWREFGCWEWTGARFQRGYGYLKIKGRGVQAHRWSYETFVGPIPEGLELDHLCRNRRCVRPDHLEPVTHRENVLRGEGIAATNAKKTHCPQGHPYSEENTYLGLLGGRSCRTCQRARNLRKREASR